MKKRILLSCIALCGVMFSAVAQSVTTASSTMTASPWTVRVPYNIADEGTKYEFKFGMGGWSWDFFAYQQRNHCGTENLRVARVGFFGRNSTSSTVATELSSEQISGGIDYTNPTENKPEHHNGIEEELAAILPSGTKSLLLLCDMDMRVRLSESDWNNTNRIKYYVNDIALAVKYIEAKGYEVLAVAPFNEPDFDALQNCGKSALVFNKVAAEMQNNPTLQGRVFGPNTLNSTNAGTWYSKVKDNINYANTHQLQGNYFSNYTSFWSQANSDGKKLIADEMHNVMEAMVCINYGGVAGTWWGWEGITRGEYVRMINGGRQLVYKERPNEWMTTSVNKYPGSNFAEAFIGTSERKATPATFTFLSKGRLAYYDGYGPTYDYTEDVPGGTGYQTGQTNAERLINIYTGEDVPIEPINGQYKIVNKASGKVLSLNNGQLERGNVYQWVDGGLPNQAWDVTPIEKTSVADYSYVIIRNANTTSASMPLYLDAQAWAMDNNANVSVWSDGDDLSTPANGWQRWHLRYVGDGYYNIINHMTGLYLNLDYGRAEDGTNVNEHSGNGTDAQLWKFVPADHAIDATAPGAPNGLTATAQSGAIKLSWSANKESDIYGYMVYRYNAIAGIWECIGRKVKGTSFLDNTCRKGQPLRYRIKALDQSYNFSAASAEVETQTTADNALVGQWTGLSFKDNSSNKLNAAVNGVTTTTDSNRPAFSFDGSDDFASLPYHVGDMQQMTFAAWVKCSSATANQRIFDFGNGEDEYMYLTPTDGSGVRFEIKKGNTTQGLTASSTLGTSSWKHVAVTIGTNGVTIYIDGASKGTTTDITLRPSDIAPSLSYLGRSQLETAYAFNGMMSDVRIYNYALSANEITELTKATISTSGFDITAERIPNIADDVNNWDTHTGKWATYSSTTEDATNLSSPYVRTTTTGMGNLIKTLTYLPEGEYKLTANVYAYYNSSRTRTPQQLFLNGKTLTISSAKNRTATLRELTGSVAADNKMEFGIKITNIASATNTAMDNVKLIYQGTITEYVEGIENISYNATSEARELLNRPMNANALSALQPLINAVDVALSNYTNKIVAGTAAPADVNEWVSEMEKLANSSAVTTAKASIEAYRQLEAQIITTRAAAAAHPQQYGNNTFNAALSEIEQNYYNGRYADNEIAAIVTELKGITNRYLMADAVALATESNPVDVTALVVSNPSFAGNSYASWESNPAPGLGYESIEFWNTDYNIYQTLIGMPAGTYRFQTRGFYRYGYQGDNLNAYNNGTLKRNAKLYITHSTEGTQVADVMAISDDPSEDTYWGGWSSELYDGKPVPNDMQAGAHAIDGCGKYVPKDGYNSVVITVNEIGDLTIGAKKETLVNGDWSFFSDFSLYYLGDGEHTLTLDEEDASLPFIDENIIYDEVVVKRTIKANGNWNTFVVPFDIPAEMLGEVWEVKELTESTLSEDGDITLTFEDSKEGIKAGVPYMVRNINMDGLTQLVMNDVNVNTTANDVETDHVYFRGVWTYGTVPIYSYFISSNQFYRCVNENNPDKLKGYRAYIEPKKSNEARSLGYRFANREEIEEGTTTIDDEMGNEATVVAIYTLNGTRIDNMQQGVNILQMSDGSTVKVIIK